MRFGHQVTAKNGGRRVRRHIPNPNVSVTSLQQAAIKWVGKWDEDDDDGYESAEGEEEDKVPSADGGGTPSLQPAHMRGGGSEMMGPFGNVGTPLGVVREEGGAWEGSSTGGLMNAPGS